MGVSFKEIDIEEVRGAEDEMRRLNGGSGRVPTIVIGDEAVLVEPTDAELRAALDRFLLASASV
jgi:glutaredoxin